MSGMQDKPVIGKWDISNRVFSSVTLLEDAEAVDFDELLELYGKRGHAYGGLALIIPMTASLDDILDAMYTLSATAFHMRQAETKCSQSEETEGDEISTDEEPQNKVDAFLAKVLKSVDSFLK